MIFNNVKPQSKKITGIPIGWREWVYLPNYRNFALKAKIDTGARTSAIHATHIDEYQENVCRSMDFLTNNIIQTIIIILAISLISQIGDLIISYFKRQAKIKDTGKIIPGHGGILDRIDGIIFVFPFIYILFKYDILIF